MAPHEQRLRLYEETKNLYSDEATNEFMTGLLPVGAADLATHDDLAVLRSHVDEQGATLRTELGVGFADLRTEMAQLRTEMGVGFADLRTEIHKSYMSVLRWCATIMVSLTAVFATLVLFR